MDGWETDDNGIINTYSIAVIKKVHQKLSNVRERKFHANFDVENESFREQKIQGTKVTSMELSFLGTKVPGYESSSYQRPKVTTWPEMLKDTPPILVKV